MSAPPPSYDSRGAGGFPIAAIVLVVVIGVVAIGGVMIALVGLGAGAYLAQRRTHTAAVRIASADLSERYQTKTGLVAVHYPADFAAKLLDDSTVMLTRNLDNGDDEGVLVGGVPVPISDDVNEFGRVLLVANKKHVEEGGAVYTELSRRQHDCLPGQNGLLVDSQAAYSTGAVTQMSTCFFMHAGHGYVVKTIIGKKNATAELPLLNRIAQSTELVDD